MIGRLSGTLVEKQPNHVIVDVGGVGYSVLIPLSTYTVLGDLEDRVTLLVHTHLREDQLQLYGFLTARERKLFEMLITVSGVGPSLALKVLSSGRHVDDLSAAIRRGEVERLVGIPGIGKKTAERIVMELRDRLTDAAAEVADARRPAGGAEAEVASALVNLGYDRREIDEVLARALRDHAAEGFDRLFRVVLAELSAARKNAPRARAKG
ncbi:MAG TPA: Holliday junction branch migration protein RuvA [Candidatus Dormibacteraeota bacterium]|nr:Holliday junction branch migration protein RuvA [Candidatus Dormibacteraeota bacterium]